MKKSLLLIVALLCLAGSVCAQFISLPPAKKRAAYGVDYYVSPSAYDYSGVARSIVGDAETRYDKAQRIYLWICDHVTYDRRGNIRTADEAWRTRTAVCQGYCELFYRLGETVGLKTRLVYGKCRRPMTSILQDHVWLSVATEHGDILVDPTWGAGFYRGENFVHQSEPLRWFDVDPSWFIFSHLPKNEMRQHLNPAVTAEQFARLTFLVPPVNADSTRDAHKELQRALGVEDEDEDGNEDENDNDTLRYDGVSAEP